MAAENRKAWRYCDGVTRRGFLRAGSLAVGGMSLAQLLRSEAQGAASAADRGRQSVIMVYLAGGMAHQDTFDLKPQAPAEVRGEFKPIATNVPGIEFGELLPLLAQRADKLAVVRSLVGQRDEHSSFQSLTGFPQDQTLREGRPNFGSAVAALAGQVDPLVPAYVDLFPTMQHRPYNIPGAGMLGQAYNGVKADGEDLANMKLRFVDGSRQSARQALWQNVDRLRSAMDSGELVAVDASQQRAFEVLTSSKLVDAMDLGKEDPKLVELYGRGSAQHLGDGAPMWNDQLLMARRLVEAGVRFVSVAYGFWDTHGNNFGHLKQHLPLFDRGISALIDDLYERGLNEQVTLCVWGEFGRTPKINANAGRDHWPAVNFALLSGARIRTGQVVGSTDKFGAYAAARPYHYRDVLATLYSAMGLEPHHLLRDISNRPVSLLPENNRPIGEVLG